MYKEEFQGKVQNCQDLIDHIYKLDSESGTVKVTAVLKTGFMMSLYNLVESTITSILVAIHDSLLAYKYNLLISPLSDLYEKYVKENKSIKLEEIINAGFYFPDYFSFKTTVKLYSGNLDLRRIKKIFKQYNIAIKVETDGSSLLKVKNYRNKVMHGEVDFAHGRYRSTQELDLIFQDIKSDFNSIFMYVDDYLDNNLYLNNEYIINK